MRNEVSLVIAGHQHLYHRGAKDNVVYVISGGGGGEMWVHTKRSRFFHYMIATNTGDGYVFETLDMEGRVRDAFSIRR